MPETKELDYISYLVIRKFPNLDSPSADNSRSRERFRKQLSSPTNSELKKLYNAQQINQYLGGDQKEFLNEPDAPADF
tara:strand:+ start:246 stop:479 length:234 start_codon:yes stop_codon:yes gene_type:complete